MNLKIIIAFYLVLLCNISVSQNNYVYADGTTGTEPVNAKAEKKAAKVETSGVHIIPNVITPNDDDINDTFLFSMIEFEELNVMLYDRFGNKVYEIVKGKGREVWNGKNSKGEDCPPGTYFYIIKGKGKDGKEYNIKGNVSLFR